MEQFLEKLRNKTDLSFEESKSAFELLMTGQANEGQVFGSKIIQAKKLMHGKTSKIKSKKIGILKNLPRTFEATRYHSLMIDKKTLSKHLEITAETDDGVVMAIQHKQFNIHGVQFHPESIKTKMGIKILKNFISY